MSSQFKHLEVYGELPRNTHAERRQFERVLSGINTATSNRMEFAVVAMHVNYSQPMPNRTVGAERWNGEFDLVFFGPDRIFIYELKSGPTRVVYGRTDDKHWKVKRGGKVRTERSWFDQASKQRTFLLQTFLNQARKNLQLPEPNHFVVDARVVCGNGSSFSGFYHKVPQTVSPEEYELLYSQAPPDDKEFLESVFTRTLEETGEYWLGPQRNTPMWKRLERIWNGARMNKKTERWFGLLEEREVAEDLAATSTTKFSLSYKDACLLAERLFEATKVTNGLKPARTQALRY